MKRRKFISDSLVYTSGTALFPTFLRHIPEEQTKVRLGFIGVGLRGQNHLEMAMYRPDVEVVAICDLDPKAIDKDPKSLLQEYLQSKKIDVPSYEVLAIEGEAHCQTFRVECRVAKFNIVTQGEGTSRRAAEQQAAELANQEIAAQSK